MFNVRIVLLLLLMAQCYNADFTPFGSACGGYYNDMTEGEITSPGYPDSNYGSNLNCTYIVTAPPDFVITYESITMDLESNDDITGLCVYDKVTVYDNNDETGTYCGDQKIYPTATTTNVFKISFTTDFEVEFKGFAIKWSILSVNSRPIELNCSFDDPIPLCAGWKNLNKDYPWHFTRGTSPSPNTGPLRDHTTDTQDGRYAYIEGSRAERNATAILVSPVFFKNRFSNQRCLRFWYHMFGTGIGGLTVALNDTVNGETKIAEYNGNKGQDWLKAEHTFTFPGMLGTVIFKGRRGTNYMSDIAIDDIDISLGSCDGTNNIPDGVDEVGSIWNGGAGVGFPNIIPSKCAGNLEKAVCPSKCDLRCDNLHEVMNATCKRACFDGCACPEDSPIFEQGICVDISLCTLDFSTAGFAEATGVVITESATTTKSVQEKIKAANDGIVGDFVRAFVAFFNTHT